MEIRQPLTANLVKMQCDNCGQGFVNHVETFHINPKRGSNVVSKIAALFTSKMTQVHKHKCEVCGSTFELSDIYPHVEYKHPTEVKTSAEQNV